jgi:hypothetical protein
MRKFSIYVAIVLFLSSIAAWQTHGAPFGCDDGYGHGPNPGSKECDNITAQDRETRGAQTMQTFLLGIALGAIGLGVYGMALITDRIFERLVPIRKDED